MTSDAHSPTNENGKSTMKRKILIVEDSPTQAMLLKVLLERHKYEVHVATDGEKGLAAARQIHPDLIVSDIMMPVMNGYEMCYGIKHDQTIRNIPVMLLSTLSNPGDIVQGINSGAGYYLIKPYDDDQLLSSVKAVFSTPAKQNGQEKLREMDIIVDGTLYTVKSSHEQILSLFLSIYQNALEQNKRLTMAQTTLKKLNESLESQVREKTDLQISSFIGTTQAIGDLLESRDPYTAGHSRGVTDLAISIAKRMGLDEEGIRGLEVCGLLHDVGKVVISSGILNKPGKLSRNEFGIIKQHPRTAYDALHRIPYPWPVAQIVGQHHERLDGSGYPQGLKGDEIHPWARILAVADVIDAMITHRPYRPALRKQDVLKELSRGYAGIYDPSVVDAWKAIMKLDTSRILVVDDEPTVLELMNGFLNHMDLEAERYEDSLQALEAFRARPFPLVITDIKMPGMNGLELLEKVREIHPAGKVIMVTGYGDKELLLKSLRLGASDFLEKPFNFENFKSAVELALKQYEEEI